MRLESKLLIIGIILISTTLLISQQPIGKATDSIQSGFSKTTYITAGKNLATIQNNQITYNINDRLGSQKINIQENQIQETNYGPYGENNKQEKSYTGKQKTNTGTTNLGAREYNTKTKRFNTPDPILQKTLTPYNYAKNNPLKYTDPDGKQVRVKTSEKIEILPHFKTTTQELEQTVVQTLEDSLFIQVLGFDALNSIPDTLDVELAITLDGFGGFYDSVNDKLFLGFADIFVGNPDSTITTSEKFGYILIHEMKHFVDSRDSTIDSNLDPNDKILNGMTDSTLVFQGPISELENSFRVRGNMERRAYNTALAYIDSLHSRGFLTGEQYKQLAEDHEVGRLIQVDNADSTAAQLREAAAIYGDSTVVQIEVPR